MFFQNDIYWLSVSRSGSKFIFVNILLARVKLEENVEFKSCQLVSQNYSCNLQLGIALVCYSMIRFSLLLTVTLCFLACYSHIFLGAHCWNEMTYVWHWTLTIESLPN